MASEAHAVSSTAAATASPSSSRTKLTTEAVSCWSPRSALSHVKTSSALDNSIVIGGADAMVVIWDCEAGIARRIIGVQDSGSEVTAVSGGLASHPDLIFAGVDDSLLAFDARSDDVKPSLSMTLGGEEMNGLACHWKEPLVAAADDSGQVTIVDVRNVKPYKVIKHAHSNLCMAASFVPRRPWDIFSVGMDCRAVMSDFSRGNVIGSIDFSHRNDAASSSAAQAPPSINPPFCNALSMRSDGRFAAAALADGTVSLIQLYKPGKPTAVASGKTSRQKKPKAARQKQNRQRAAAKPLTLIERGPLSNESLSSVIAVMFDEGKAAETACQVDGQEKVDVATTSVSSRLVCARNDGRLYTIDIVDVQQEDKEMNGSNIGDLGLAQPIEQWRAPFKLNTACMASESTVALFDVQSNLHLVSLR